MSATLVTNNVIPIIDMAYIRANDVWPIKSCTRQSAYKLYRALVDQGLALLVNHGITELKLQQAYRRLDYFSKQPDSEKKDYILSSNSSNETGYIPPGPKISGQLLHYRHVYNIKSGDENLVPQSFCSAHFNPTEIVVDDFKALASTLLQFIAIGIGISPKHFRNVHDKLLKEGDESLFQLVYYPPTDDCEFFQEKSPEGNTEFGMFVLLAQDSENGLEVYQCKKWVPVGHLPGAILMICGNLLKIWSDELCLPVPYRFTVPSDQNVRSRSRHCAIYASRLPSRTIDLCPAKSPQLHCNDLEPIIASNEDLTEDIPNENLSPLHRAIDFIRKTCRIPSCKCTS